MAARQKDGDGVVPDAKLSPTLALDLKSFIFFFFLLVSFSAALRSVLQLSYSSFFFILRVCVSRAAGLMLTDWGGYLPVTRGTPLPLPCRQDKKIYKKKKKKKPKEIKRKNKELLVYEKKD